VWTWTGIDGDTKLIVSYLIGPRHPPMAYEFMKDLASRLVTRVQLTTDGLTWYEDTVDHAFGIDVDFAMVTKHYGAGGAADASAAIRYSPTTITSMTKEVIRGNSNDRYISTSYVVRTSRCACRCAASRASRTGSLRSWRITPRQWHCTSRTTTSAASMARFA
jgi:hypothetical protein